MPKNSKQAKIVCLAQYKGGTGKTSASVNLSVALKMLGKKVLVVDLDQQANATAWLGLAPAEIKKTVTALLLDEDETVSVDDVLIHTEEGVDILPASIDLVKAERQLKDMAASEHQLAQKLETVRDRYDWIVLDTPPAAGEIGMTALVASDYVLIPVQPEPLCLQGMSNLYETINLVQRKKTLNPNLDILGLFISAYDRRRAVHKQLAEYVRQQWSKKVFNTTIHHSTVVAEAPSAQKSLFLYAPTAEVTKDFQSLAQEVVARG